MLVDGYFPLENIVTKVSRGNISTENIFTQVQNISPATRNVKPWKWSLFKKWHFSRAPQRKLLKCKNSLFWHPTENLSKPLEDDGFCIAKTIENHRKNDGFLRDVKKVYNLNLSTFSLSLKRLKILLEKKIREISFWETRTRIENATMRQNHIFYVFG